MDRGREREKVSVIMGIYNCADTLEEAVISIQKQTYSNWELILCDDGSTDNTYEIAKKLARNDDRIILICNNNNVGLNITLNHCLEYVTGEYVARMDGDDLCSPERFEKQVSFLQVHPEYAIVSSKMNLFDENGIWGEINVPEYPTSKQIVAGSPICHAPVMMRKYCMDRVKGYTVDSRMLRVEDVNLWIKLYYYGYKCYNIQEPLYSMRNDCEALNRRKYRYRINSTFVRLQGCLMLKLGLKSYIMAFRPMLNGLVPARVRYKIRKFQNR